MENGDRRKRKMKEDVGQPGLGGNTLHLEKGEVDKSAKENQG